MLEGLKICFGYQGTSNIIYNPLSPLRGFSP